MNNKLTQTIVISSIILVAALSRLIPHELYNFTPILAMALFGGAMLKNRVLSYTIPLAAMLASDIFLGFHSTMPFVYAAILGAALLGRMIIKRTSAGNVLAGSLLAAVLFFVVSNFGHWLMTPMYTKTLDGLVLCYTNAIPFFRMTLVSTLVFSATFFGVYHLLQQKVTALKPEKIQA